MQIQDAIAHIRAWDTAGAVRVTALSGGITNLNYRVDVDGEPFVVRILARDAGLLGIDRHREHRCAVAASRAGVAPEVVYFLPDEGILVTRFIAGSSLAPGEPAAPEMVRRVAQAIRRCHTGPAFDGTFSPFETVESYVRIARGAGAALPQDLEVLRAVMREIDAALRQQHTVMRPCHNDLWGPNLIDDGREVHIVDWEYAGMGDACFDLANFAIHHSFSDDQDAVLLRAYFGVVPVAAEARVKLLKVAAELREALWYLVALNVSSDTTHFLEHAQVHFDRCRRAMHDPHVSMWLDQVGRG